MHDNKTSETKSKIIDNDKLFHLSYGTHWLQTVHARQERFSSQ